MVFPPPPLVGQRRRRLRCPAVAPASLAGFVDPVADDAGRVVDWVLGREPAVRRGRPEGVSRVAQRLGAHLGARAAHATCCRCNGSWRDVPDVPRVAALLGALVARPETVRIEPSDDLRPPRPARRSSGGDRRPRSSRERRSSTRRRAAGRPSASHGRGAPRRCPSCSPPTRATGVVIDPTDGLVVVDRTTGDRRITDIVETDLRGEVVIVTNQPRRSDRARRRRQPGRSPGSCRHRCAGRSGRSRRSWCGRRCSPGSPTL